MGWLVDGAVFTLQLMPYKCVDFSKLIKNLCKQSYYPVPKSLELSGKLQHASFGIPGGKRLFSPIHEALKTTPQIGQSHAVSQSDALRLENPSPTPCAAPNPDTIAS